jgi:hypothetical protein
MVGDFVVSSQTCEKRQYQLQLLIYMQYSQIHCGILLLTAEMASRWVKHGKKKNHSRNVAMQTFHHIDFEEFKMGW